MNPTRWLTWLFAAFCLAGFSVQVYYISDRYFEFTTATSTKIALPARINAYSASVCIRYPDLVPLEDGRPSYMLDSEAASARIGLLTQSMTIAQIFAATPVGDDLMVKCLYRKPHTYEIFRGTKDECLQVFPVTKYFMMEYICYAFISANSSLDKPYIYQNLAFSLQYPGLLFSVTLNKTLVKGADFMKVIVHGPVLPVDSISYAPSFYRVVNQIEKVC